ncbi:MAG: hypothetical protein AAF432_05880 [Planctomycetota bacterium]
MATQKNFNASAAVLWASAFVITALIITQAGRISGNAAYAESANSNADFTMLTTQTRVGTSPPAELLYVIDERGEMLFLYEIENAQKKQITLRQAGSLQNLFRNASR